MNILYCGDKGIARGVLVSILSILEHNKGVLHFYIMTIHYQDTEAFTEKSAKFLDELVKKTNAKSFVKLIDATDVFVKNLPKKNMGSYFTPASMLRLYIDKVPEIAKLDRVLYLDYDVMCRGDLSEFYNTDLEGIEAAGVLDIYGRRWYHYHGLLKQDYMNSGVMLFNMSECLKSGMFKKTVELCTKRWMMLADQAALNKSIEKRKLMSRRYNEQEERPREDTILHHFSNNFKFWPYFHVQKVKPFEIDKVHEVLKITEYDNILNEYNKLKDNL
ncbi:glycosyltransferase family 8 protein [Candidatus Saccharibacteria bacterium]|nr:glycosyltransferase family 8 protein [Candidatus Saccharibacteria bacterium]